MLKADSGLPFLITTTPKFVQNIHISFPSQPNSNKKAPSSHQKGTNQSKPLFFIILPIHFRTMSFIHLLDLPDDPFHFILAFRVK